jgi:hypothetical protein
MRTPSFHLATNASACWLASGPGCCGAFVDEKDAHYTLETST